MRLVIQRVRRASVTVDEEVIGQIGRGLLVLVGVAQGDGAADIRFCARKVVQLRIFEDEQGKMNRSVQEIEGGILLVSQFTLLGNTRKGNRPSFTAAAPPDEASRLFEELVTTVKSSGVTVATGRFQAAMEVELLNQGPVTLVVDSRA